MLIILALWKKYWNSPVVTVFQPTETPIDLIPFPAITICNVNNVRKSRANQYIEYVIFVVKRLLNLMFVQSVSITFPKAS